MVEDTNNNNNNNNNKEVEDNDPIYVIADALADAFARGKTKMPLVMKVDDLILGLALFSSSVLTTTYDQAIISDSGKKRILDKYLLAFHMFWKDQRITQDLR